MHGEPQFHTTYIAMIALAWNALERIDRHLGAERERTVMSELPLLRLELLQLGEKASRCAGSRLFSTSQNVLVQRLVAKLLGWLDFDVAATTEVARMRIWSAQNWLFDEAKQGEQIELHDVEARRG